MTDSINPSTPLTPEELIKKTKDGLDVWPDMERYANEGFAAIDMDDMVRFKWYGVYQQRPKEGHFMMRMKNPGGQITSAQFEEISKIAQEFGNGFADVTTRQDIQYHYLTIETIPLVVKRLRAVGITTTGACGDTPRNVTTCPVAGVDGHELFDATPEVLEVTRFFTGNKAFSNLPRKFKMSISGCPIHCSQPDINCVGLIGVERKMNGKTEQGYLVQVGGGLSTDPHMSQRLGIFVPRAEAARLCEGIAIVYREHGYRNARRKSRIKFLMADWGVEKFRDELEKVCGKKFERFEEPQAPVLEYRDHVGIHPQKQKGLNYVGLSILVGRFTAQQGLDIARLAKKYGSGEVRLTNNQNIIIINVPDANVTPLVKELDSAGLAINGNMFRRGMVTCTGKEFCNLAITETKARSKWLIEELDKLLPEYKDSIRINMTGCTNTCGQAQIGDVGFIGTLANYEGQRVEAFHILLGGGLGNNRAFGRQIKKAVPAVLIPGMIRNILAIYQSEKHAQESFKDFCWRYSPEQLSHFLEGKLS
ncbi:MAG: nitrite/sulfite reductase [Candidatus Omnitrophica bacterium]|nr:nitrite/sulfite reductase [Candidatus Omnitrophota bacterium]